MEKKSNYCIYSLFIMLSVLYTDIQTSKRVKIATIVDEVDCCIIKKGSHHYIKYVDEKCNKISH